jgi:hypothetical protein
MNHLCRQEALNPAMILQVPRHNVNPSIGIVCDPKKRQTVDMIPVRMSQKKVGCPHIPLEELFAHATNAGAGIKKEPVVSDADLDAAGITAVPNMVGRRYRYASPDTPELYAEHKDARSIAKSRVHVLHPQATF